MGDPERKLYVSKKFIDIFSYAHDSPGYIAGLKKDEETFCIASSLCTDYFIPGLKILGIYCVINYEFLSESELISCCKDQLSVLKVELEDPLVLFIHKDEDSIKFLGKIFSPYYSTLSEISTTYLSHNPAILLRAQGKIPLLFETSSDTDTLKENIELAVERLRVTFQSQVAAFLLKNSTFILTPSRDDDNSSITCGNLHQYYEDPDLAEIFKKNKRSMKRKVPVNFNIIVQTTGDAAVENTVNHSLVIHCQRREYQCVSLSLPVDVLIVCLESSSTHSIYQQFLNAIHQQLENMNECLLKYAKNSGFVCPVPHHFYPDTWDIPFTIIYPSNKTDEEQEAYRRSLHKLLLLPIDRPILRKPNKYEFFDVTSGYLINPHEGLPSSGVVEGKTSVVYGRYAYHHYMQDHMNDNGWGCAYRSLQTIISWFKFQGYTNKNIPTHLEIQHALVDIGDKPQTFVGSKKWIGSQEVSFCLDQLIQVQSKIMCVNSGAEMANKGRELFLHFHDQGTPIMIGGGVLAHTILGVDFNKNTGDLKFLILDPHYTGGEDLNLIQNKGWCGWKGVNFWDQNAFYNLCLPQRPLQI